MPPICSICGVWTKLLFEKNQHTVTGPSSNQTFDYNLRLACPIRSQNPELDWLKGEQQPKTSWLNWPMTATIRCIYRQPAIHILHDFEDDFRSSCRNVRVNVNNNSSFQPDDHTRQTIGV